MDSDIKIGKANGGVMVIVGIVQFLFGAAVFVSVVTLFMTYALGLGEWSFRALNHMRVVEVGYIALMASVLIGVAYSAVFKPIALVAQNSIKKKLLYSDLVGLTEDEVYVMRYFERIMNTTTICAVVSGIVVGAIALLAHDPMMSILGNPTTDILTLLIVVVGPYILTGILGTIATSGLRREDPELYNAWANSGI